MLHPLYGRCLMPGCFPIHQQWSSQQRNARLDTGIVKRISHRAASMIRRPRIDLPLLGALFLLAMIGLATQYSASDLNVDPAMARASDCP